ncbi:MAG: hypothetical protein IKI50_05625, partial [Clostridia bacterium]|nr:hypothetical protein [Clostridia bacterium]
PFEIACDADDRRHDPHLFQFHVVPADLREQIEFPQHQPPDTFGYSFVGLTRTFKAKVEGALNDGYQEHYFPDKASTSILMQGDESLNEKTFWYTYRDHVPYTVKYVALDGAHAGEEIHESKYVADNSKAVVTEKFVHISNYVPTAYYLSKTLIVSDDPAEEAAQNVIIFYYREDTINMPYHVSYLVEDTSGTVIEEINGQTVRFIEKNFIDGYAERGTTQTIGINTYGGFDVHGYKEIAYDTDGTGTEGPMTALTESTASIAVELTASLGSKEIQIYYLKRVFPVKVIYQISSTEDEKIVEFNSIIEGLEIAGLQRDPASAVTIGGNTYYKVYYKIVPDQKFNSLYVEVAPNVSGFLLSGNEMRTRIISADDENITNNRIVFTYTALNEVVYFYYSILPRGNTYVLGNPANPKLLSINQEVVVIGERPYERCEAVLDNPIYTFVGWYSDEACTSPVTNILYGTEYVLTSTAPGAENAILPLPASENRSYYAKYDFRRGDMTISVTDDAVTDAGQAFEVIVQGQDEDNNWVNLHVALDPAGIGTTDSVTVKDLPVGHYTVRQGGWSWRYDEPTPVSQTRTVEDKDLPGSTTASAAFTETFLKTKWLDGNAALDNDFGEHDHTCSAVREVVTLPPTCSTDGVKNLVCAGCGKILGTATIPAAHTYGTWIVGTDATTSSTGTLGHYHCDACGTDFQADYSVLTDLTAPIRTDPIVQTVGGAQVYRINADAVRQNGAYTPVGILPHAVGDGFTVVRTNGGTENDICAFFIVPAEVLADLPYLVIETESAGPAGLDAGLTVSLSALDNALTAHDLCTVSGSTGRCVVDVRALCPSGSGFTCRLLCNGTQDQALSITGIMMTDTVD